MRRVLLFALSVVALTAPPTWLWLHGGGALYADWITPVARRLYDWIGLHGQGTMHRLRFINGVPFTALMLLTPGLSWRRRLGGLASGWAILIAAHIALNGMAIASGARGGQLPPLPALGSDALPFLLWFVFARDFVRETMESVRGGERAAAGHAIGGAVEGTRGPADGSAAADDDATEDAAAADAGDAAEARE